MQGRVFRTPTLREGIGVLAGFVMDSRRKKQQQDIRDVDHALRAASRLFPEALTPFVVAPWETVASFEWTETQIALRQKRLDRTLMVKMGAGEFRWLHIEWTDRLNRRMFERMAEYHWDLSLVAMQDAATRRKNGDKDARPVWIESVVVVLNGRKKPWPMFGAYRSSAPNQRFSGVRFRIEAVYQKTVEELASMGSVFWLAFVPLARDVDEEKLRHVINTLRCAADDYDFAELVLMMVSFAKLKKDRPELETVLLSELKEEKPVRSMEWFYTKEVEWIKSVYRTEGTIEGRIIGRREGLKDGRVEGREEGREEGLAFLRCQFERKLERALTEHEWQRLRRRFVKEGPRKIANIILDYSSQDLAKWLAPRKNTSKSSKRRIGVPASSV